MGFNQIDMLYKDDLKHFLPEISVNPYLSKRVGGPKLI